MIKFLKSNWIIITLTIIGLFFRLWRLKYPQELVFDETYYANFAHQYLLRTSFLDAHPPLGKVIIEIGIKIFGFNSFGWRIMPAIIGTLIIPLIYLVAQKIFKNKMVAILSAILIVFDGLFLVESRNALIMGFMPVFILGGYYFGLSYIENKKTLYIFLTGLMFGLSFSIQWLSLPFWGALFIFMMIKKAKISWQLILLYFILPIIMYFLVFYFDHHNASYQNIWQYFIKWNQDTFNFHSGVKETHPYASRWQTWMYLYRPVWFYYKNIDDKILGTIALGNPLIWWPAILTFIYSIYYCIKNRIISLTIPLVSFLFYYLSWIAITRLQFQYYIFLALPFYFMILAYFWQKIWQKWPWLGWLYLILIIATFIFFYPILTAYPITQEHFNLLIWSKRWI
jgi:dolichyl-phosphate-mannose-protein mannosyltransferase